MVRARRRCAAMLVLALGMVAVGCSGDDGSSTDTAATGATSAATGVVPEGFDTATVRIRRADGSVCELCTYAARDRAQWSLGLMGVTDLDGHDGMIFVFDEPGVHRFWMKNTVMPLTAAWFAPDGAFVEAHDMAPCPPDSDRCPSYGPAVEVSHVLEVPQGDLERLGVGAGSVLVEVGAPCDPG